MCASLLSTPWTGASRLPNGPGRWQPADLPLQLCSLLIRIDDPLHSLLQGVTGQYTLRSKLQAVVDGIQGLAGNVTMEIDTAMDLIDYADIHPIYLQAKSFICCDTVSNMFGNLWLSLFISGAMSIVLIMSMFAYIKRLDELPSRR